MGTSSVTEDGVGVGGVGGAGAAALSLSVSFLPLRPFLFLRVFTGTGTGDTVASTSLCNEDMHVQVTKEACSACCVSHRR